MAYEIDLSKQVALVTGGGQGIGAAIATVLSWAGAQVVICDISEETAVSEVLAKTAALGFKAHYINCDISDETQVQKMIDVIDATFGRLDILVNNAGINSDWDSSYAVNTKGMYYCCDLAKDLLSKSKGRIVNITSASVFTGGTGFPAYNVTKAGCYALTMFFARNYAKLGIRVNGIAPAVIMSKMIIDRFGSEEKIYEHYKDIMPLGRIGYPQDIANIVLFLVSDLSAFMTGEILFADGGRMHIGG